MAKVPSLRRTDRGARPGAQRTAEDDTGTTRVDTRQPDSGTGAQAGTEDRPPAYSTKVERAAERAADATRSAAAAAAKRAQGRPRTSVLASLGLVLAVVAALAVTTGTLTRLGIAIAVVAVLAGLAGLAATARFPRRSGRLEATIGLLLASAAIVVGGLAVGGTLPWLDPDTDNVQRLADWLPGWLS
jgi:hypothetical protein